jgi:alanine racemase
MFYGFKSGSEPPLSVFARVLQTRRLAKGDPVGYFGHYRAPRDMRTATLAIGAEDGYVKCLSKTNRWQDVLRARLRSGAGFAKSYAVIGGFKCPLVGLVSMNNITLDASAVPEKVMASCEWAEVVGKNALIRDFRGANGYIPDDMLVYLAKPNPGALDLDADEFAVVKDRVLGPPS